MTWGDEGWQQAARDYQAGRKHGRRQGTIQMDLKREVSQAEIIPLGKHRSDVLTQQCVHGRNVAGKWDESHICDGMLERWRRSFSSTLLSIRRTMLLIEPLSQSDRASLNSCFSDSQTPNPG